MNRALAPVALVPARRATSCTCPTCSGAGFVTRERTRGVSPDCNMPLEVIVSERPAPPHYPGPTLYTVRSTCPHCAGRGSLPLHPAELRA